jgi:aspartate/methionine/tyrosine aminotransferase
MPIKRVIIDKATRLYQMPPDILDFVRTARKTRLIRKTETIDLASFHWPLAFDSDDVLAAGDLEPAGNSLIGSLEEEIAAWMAARHRVRLLPGKEIYVGGSVADLVYRLALALIDFGDIAFVPELGVPLYRQAVTAFGGEPVKYGIASDNNWLPTFERVQTRLGRVATSLFLNSPHDPTGATLTERELTDLVGIAARENILLINDATHQGIPERLPASLLSVDGGKKTGVEIYSLPHLAGMPHVPLGFVIGNRDVIRILREVDAVYPRYLPAFHVRMATEALGRYPSDSLRSLRKSIHQATAESNQLLDKLSLEKAGLDGVPFVWARMERRSNSVAAARML